MIDILKPIKPQQTKSATNPTNQTNPTTTGIDREKFINDRKMKRKALKSTPNQQAQNEIRQEIDQSLINQKKQEIELKQEKMNEIKEAFYTNTDRLIKLYQVLGIITNQKQINERYQRSDNYYRINKRRNIKPNIALMKMIVDDIKGILKNKNVITEIYNKKWVKTTLKEIIEEYKSILRMMMKGG